MAIDGMQTGTAVEWFSFWNGGPWNDFVDGSDSLNKVQEEQKSFWLANVLGGFKSKVKCKTRLENGFCAEYETETDAQTISHITQSSAIDLPQQAIVSNDTHQSFGIEELNTVLERAKNMSDQSSVRSIYDDSETCPDDEPCDSEGTGWKAGVSSGGRSTISDLWGDRAASSNSSNNSNNRAEIAGMLMSEIINMVGQPAAGNNGNTTEDQTGEIPEAKEIKIDFRITDTNGTKNLIWNAENADACSTDNDWAGTTPEIKFGEIIEVNGQLPITPPNASAIYKIFCMNSSFMATTSQVSIIQ